MSAERSHLGPVMDERVAEARLRVRTDGDEDYDLVSRHFDFVHYLLQTPGLLDRREIDLVEHFLADGVSADRSPDPNFSMSDYLKRHPDRGEETGVNPYVAWLRHGREAGEVADPAPALEDAAHVVGIEPAEFARKIGAVRKDLEQRMLTGTIGEMFAKAAEVEPLVSAAWPSITAPNIPPVVAPYVVHQLAAIKTCQEQAGFRRARLVLVINRPRWGGGRRMEGHLAHALARYIDPSEIVVIHTDESGTTPPGRYPAGVRELDFAAASAPTGRRSAQRALVELIRSFHADAVVNINSRLLYDSMTSFGQALARSERIFPVFFCGEQTVRGNWVGYPFRQFYRILDSVAGVITDSEHWREWFRGTYQLDEAAAGMLHVFNAPVDPGVGIADRPATKRRRRPRVYWAGRWDRQKRIGLVLRIAARMPDVDFILWGEAVLDGKAPGDLPPNVALQGRYVHVSDLDLATADLWLYTSGWDGVPSQLLEVGMTGVPIVATLVGGTGEVLSDDDAWLVPEDADASAYEQAIRSVLSDPGGANLRAEALRERLLRERTEDDFAEHVASVLLANPASEERTA